VPHTEVELILLNGDSVGFDALLLDGDRVAVYPRFETFDVTPLLRVRGQPLRDTRFIADAHLGGLAHLLRMTGFDTLYDNHFGDDEIERLALAQARIVLTRDRELLKCRDITHGAYVRALKAQAQLREVAQRFASFTRVLGVMRRVSRQIPGLIVVRSGASVPGERLVRGGIGVMLGRVRAILGSECPVIGGGRRGRSRDQVRRCLCKGCWNKKQESDPAGQRCDPRGDPSAFHKRPPRSASVDARSDARRLCKYAATVVVWGSAAVGAECHWRCELLRGDGDDSPLRRDAIY